MSKPVPLVNADFGANRVPVPGTSYTAGRLHLGATGTGAVERLLLDEERGVIIAEAGGRQREYPFTAAIGGIERASVPAAKRERPAAEEAAKA